MSPEKMCYEKKDDSKKLAALTFFAKSCGDICGSNGLPITPYSIGILGRFQFLKTLKHENLTEYLDVIRGKHERTVIVSEYFGKPLNEIYLPNQEVIIKIFYQIANALDHINKNNFANHALEPGNILVDDSFNVKLFNYGLFFMTNNQKFVSFPIANTPKYLPPERIMGNHGNIKSDVWSLGMIVVEMLFGKELWSSLKVNRIIRKILSYCKGNNVLEKIAKEHDCMNIYENLDGELKSLLESCLTVSSKNRPLPDEILESNIFEKHLDFITFKMPAKDCNELSPLERCDYSQIYYLWQLAGGDIQGELKKEGLIRSEAPIFSVPKLVLLEGKSVAAKRNQSMLFDNRVVLLNMQNLVDRLSVIPKRAFYPLLTMPEISINYGATEMQKLPLVIRERDIEYQFHRVVLFTRLLKGYPYTRDLIEKEAKIDIPPLLRGKIWSCILNVVPNGKYEKIDKVTPTSTDRQIEVDIPRCHQYDELLSSPTAHFKLKRLLKAWITSHPQYVYWQGLDSLTAPFLYLNFNNEELAFLCLYNFIPKYLHWFFLKDNSQIIKEYLSKFSQLTTYHDPVLGNHLREISFIPELFAIPWFLTLFSHVFPLHKILHLWDKLLLGDNSYPLFIGIAILKQLKNTLMESGFNECILLFSDLPDIVMEQCVTDSEIMYAMTPKSVCYRKYVHREQEPGPLDINNVELSDIQKEFSPRISANDLQKLLKSKPDQVLVIDLRSIPEFNRSHIKNSINVPFNSIMLSDRRLEALNVPDFAKRVRENSIKVIVSVSHENACLFAEFLLECKVNYVTILHKGFQVLHSIQNPSILVSS